MEKFDLIRSTFALGLLLLNFGGITSTYGSDDIDPNDGPLNASSSIQPTAPMNEGALEEIAPDPASLVAPKEPIEADTQAEQPPTNPAASLETPPEGTAEAPSTEKANAETPTTQDSKSAEHIEEKPTLSTNSDATAQPKPMPLVLLNGEVPPGTSASLGWQPVNSFTSITAPTRVLVVNGVKPGPTLCLTAAIHGDELNGIEIVRKVLFDIDPKALSGAVIGVPIVNLDGFRRGSRYLTDRRDLNRFFPGNPVGSAASRLAHSFFTEIIQHCTLLIDLHTGSFRRTNLPQLRADLAYTQVTDLADKMGSILVVQSQGAVGSLRRAAVEAGIPSVTLEAGAAHEFSRSAVEAGVKSVENALHGLKMLKLRRFWERTPQPIYFESTWVRASHSGILFSNVELGQHVEKGEILGTITDPITNVQALVTAPIDGHVIGKALNQIMFPGFAAYHLGYKTKPHAGLDVAPFKTQDPQQDHAVDLPVTPTKNTEYTGETGDLLVNDQEEVEGAMGDGTLDPEPTDEKSDE